MHPFTVSPEKEDELRRRMQQLGVREEDLEESFVRSGGHGGQNVNKVATCVMLRHLPSGIQVKCQTTRRQGRNRFLARHLLCDKLEARRKERAALARAEQERARRRTRKRSRAAKEKMLEGKSRRSRTKALRRRVNPD